MKNNHNDKHFQATCETETCEITSSKLTKLPFPQKSSYAQFLLLGIVSLAPTIQQFERKREKKVKKICLLLRASFPTYVDYL